MTDIIPAVEKIFVILGGLIWGSFLNVCIHRLPKDLSIVKPPSACPKCKALIQWYDNIPLLSYLLLGGKCRDCKEKISLRYPLVEFISGLVFFILYLQLGLGVSFIKFAIFFSLLIVVSFIDIDYHAIPAVLIFLGITIGLALSIYETVLFLKGNFFIDLSHWPLINDLKGLIFGFGFAYLFKFFGDFFIGFYLSLRNKESIEGETESLGLGDVDFLGMAGLFLGMKSAALIFFLAPFFAVIYAVIAFIFKKSHLIPYLPYLSAASIAVYFWGDKIWKLVFNF